MKGLNIPFNLLCLTLLLVSCTKEIRHKNEAIKYLKDIENGLTKEVVKSDVLTSVTYLPEKLIYRNRESAIDKTDNSERLCFVFCLSKNGKELLSQVDGISYGDLLQTLSFKMVPLVSLQLDNGASVMPSDCLFQQTYGLSTSNELLLIFDSEELKGSKALSLTIEDFGLGLGNLNYNFLTNDIDVFNKVLKI